MTEIAIVDGQLMPLSEARVSVLDLGFLRGVGAFETLRTYGGHPHAVAEHARRWLGAASALGIPAPLDAAELRRALVAAIAATGASECRINLILTPGEHTGGVFGASHPTWVAIVRELVEPPDSWYRDGVRVVSFRGERVCPEFKTTAYITGRPGLLAAEAAGAQEAIYVDADGHVSEGVTSNVLALHGATIRSPSAPSLPGITRRTLHDLAAELGLAWEDVPLRIPDFQAADEVWLTSAVREVMPVIALDDQPVADGRPGPWAARLRQAFRARVTSEAAADAEQHA